MRIFPGDKEMTKISAPEYDIDTDMCLVVEFGCIDCDLNFAFKVSLMIYDFFPYLDVNLKCDNPLKSYYRKV